MRIWTTQIRNIERARKQVEGVTFYDVTQKSGDKMFAPDWCMVMAYKNGRISWDEFTAYYNDLMRDRFRENRDYYIRFCFENSYVLTCYCKSKTKCHRHLLAKLLRDFCNKNGIHFEFGGEIS